MAQPKNQSHRIYYQISINRQHSHYPKLKKKKKQLLIRRILVSIVRYTPSGTKSQFPNLLSVYLNVLTTISANKTQPNVYNVEEYSSISSVIINASVPPQQTRS